MQSTAPIVHPSNAPRETGTMTPPLHTRQSQTAGSPHPAHVLHGPLPSEGRCRPSTNTRPNHNPLKRGRRLNKQCGRRGHEQVNCSGSHRRLWLTFLSVSVSYCRVTQDRAWWPETAHGLPGVCGPGVQPRLTWASAPRPLIQGWVLALGSTGEGSASGTTRAVGGLYALLAVPRHLGLRRGSSLHLSRRGSRLARWEPQSYVA